MKKVFQHEKVLVFVVLLVILVCLIGGYFVYQHNLEKKRDEKILEIKSHYGSFVVINNGASIYKEEENEYQTIGTFSSKTIFPLEELEITMISDIYFPIAGTNYYLSYVDVEPVLENVVTTLPDYYLPLGKKIITREKTNLYQKDVLILTLEESNEFEVLYGDDAFYYVAYFGDIFGIKKEEVDVEELSTNDDEASYISTIQFAKMDEQCKNSNCITLEKEKEFLKQFSENGCYSITESEYLWWLNHDLRIKPGAMLMTLADANESLISSATEFGYEIVETDYLTFVNNDRTTNKDMKKENVNRYFIHQSTTSDQIKKVIAGETIEKPKPVVTTQTKNPPSMDAKATNIAVLNYHFFYDPSIGESCGDGNCMPVAQFREQLDYLKANHYKTLTMEEYRAWMYGELELPARSVLITIDDGAMGTGKHNGNKLIPILEEYQMHATLFLITGWWDINNYRSEYLDIESHTYDMHTERVCTNQTRGAKMLCSTKEQVLDDLRKSLSVTGSNKAFCFPFYAYNDSAIQSLKEVGFQLGFIGGYTKSNRHQDKYKITRYPVHRSTTLNQFINMIN